MFAQIEKMCGIGWFDSLLLLVRVETRAETTKHTKFTELNLQGAITLLSLGQHEQPGFLNGARRKKTTGPDVEARLQHPVVTVGLP